MIGLIKNLTHHIALGRVLMFAGGALATLLYALLAILATPALMQDTTPAIAALINQCLLTLVAILSGLEVMVLVYLYQLMLSRYREEFWLYRTLGMPRWYLVLQLICENLIWAVMTSGIGTVGGVICSKFFVMWLFRMMALPLNTGLLWSGQATIKLLIGYTLGYILLAISGWLRFCPPLEHHDHQPQANDHEIHKGLTLTITIFAPLLVALSDFGLGHWSSPPKLMIVWLGNALIGIFGVCAFTLPAILERIALIPGIRQHASWLLSVRTSRQLLKQHWLTMSLITDLLSGATVLLLGGLIQYLALHKALAPVALLNHLIAVASASVDATAGITLFTTTITSLAMIIAAAIMLRLMQRLNNRSQDREMTLYQLGMPQALLDRSKDLQTILVAGLPLILGVLNAVTILACKMALLIQVPHVSWFILVALVLYLTIIQSNSRTVSPK